MRARIEIGDHPVNAAMKTGGFKTRREAVEEGPRLIARRSDYPAIRALRGKLHWDDPANPAPAWEPAGFEFKKLTNHG